MAITAELTDFLCLEFTDERLGRVEYGTRAKSGSRTAEGEELESWCLLLDSIFQLHAPLLELNKDTISIITV